MELKDLKWIGRSLQRQQRLHEAAFKQRIKADKRSHHKKREVAVGDEPHRDQSPERGLKPARELAFPEMEKHVDSADEDKSDSADDNRLLKDPYLPKKYNRRNLVAPVGFQRSRCSCNHTCTNSDCWTNSTNPRIVWDRSRYSRPFTPKEFQNKPTS